MTPQRKKRSFCGIELHTVVKLISLSCILIGCTVDFIYIWQKLFLLASIESFAIVSFLFLYCGCQWKRECFYIPFLVFHSIVGIVGLVVGVWFLAHGLLMLARESEIAIYFLVQASFCLIFSLMNLLVTHIVYMDYRDLRKQRRKARMQFVYLNGSPSLNKKLYQYRARSSMIV
ncbi:hypothetical protein M3Y97_00976600 [Aphelenchoides bicaudatus]|nr:hypothetical protein M3Y97_00976600 [Aphelenchoides bicaudatus]